MAVSGQITSDWCSSSLFQQRLTAEEKQPNPEPWDPLLTDSNISRSSFHILKLRDDMSLLIKDKQVGVLAGGWSCWSSLSQAHKKTKPTHCQHVNLYLEPILKLSLNLLLTGSWMLILLFSTLRLKQQTWWSSHLLRIWVFETVFSRLQGVTSWPQIAPHALKELSLLST